MNPDLNCTCRAPGCDRPTSDGRTYCWAHFKRLARGTPLSPPLKERLTPWGEVVEASIVLAFSDSEDDVAWERNVVALRRAVGRWAASMAHSLNEEAE